jgi:hypothetical protein
MVKDKAKAKKPKKCKNLSGSRGRRTPWYVFGAVGLAARGVAALALLAIAIKMYPLKQEAKFFNACIEETRNSGKSISSAVRFCNGGI